MKLIDIRKILIACCLFMSSEMSFADEDSKIKFNIYIDADFSNAAESGNTIYRAIDLALSEENYNVNNVSLTLKKLDNHGNPLRSKKHFREISQDIDALAVFGGIQSISLLYNQSFINSNELLTFASWAGDSSIIKPVNGDSWVFKLGISDKHVQKYFEADNKCKKPIVYVEKTAWGKRIAQQLHDKFHDMHLKKYEFSWFELGVGKFDAESSLLEAIEANHDCSIIVSSSIEELTFLRAMLTLHKEDRIPVYTYSNGSSGFYGSASAGVFNSLDIKFPQACFSFNEDNPVYTALKSKYSDSIHKKSDMKAAPAFAQTYDLTKIFIQAIKEVKPTQDVVEMKKMVKTALEKLKEPVVGLLDTYKQPFRSVTVKNEGIEHEAFPKNKVCSAMYGVGGQVLLNKQKEL